MRKLLDMLSRHSRTHPNAMQRPSRGVLCLTYLSLHGGEERGRVKLHHRCNHARFHETRHLFCLTSTQSNLGRKKRGVPNMIRSLNTSQPPCSLEAKCFRGCLATTQPTTWCCIAQVTHPLKNKQDLNILKFLYVTFPKCKIYHKQAAWYMRCTDSYKTMP